MTLCTAVTFAALGLFVGCSEEDLIPQGATTSMSGTYSDQSNAAGVIDLDGLQPPEAARLSRASTEPYALTGTLTLAGQAPIPLSGLWDPLSGALGFSSDDGQYNFSGQVIGSQASGFQTGPATFGSFVLFVGGASVKVFCGTAICVTPVDCDATGSFNLSVSGSVALLSVYYNGDVGFGAGTATATEVEFSVQGVNISGDISGSTVSGTWDDTNNGYAGTWNGSTAACTAAP